MAQPQLEGRLPISAPFTAPGGRLGANPVDAFRAAAFEIGARLIRDAVWDGGRCNWFSPVYDDFGGSQQLGFGTLGPTLYDGTAGIGLFLAELHAATADPAAAATAAGALEHALGRVGDIPEGLLPAFYTGGLGIAYAAHRAGLRLARGELAERGLELARQAAAAASDESAIDVMSGDAGAIPALLRLARETADASFLEAARAAGERLLARAERSERGLSWDTTGDMKRIVEAAGLAAEGEAMWLDSDRPHLTGYSHGAGGVGIALVELGAATGEDRFTAAGRDAFAYEDSSFDSARDLWPDLRGDNGGGSAWCHGAAGIGLARLRAWRLTGDRGFLEGVQRALRIAARPLVAGLAGGAMNYSLCHGAAGDAELFALAAEWLRDEQAAQLALAVALHGISTFAEPKAPWPGGVPGAIEAPGLMLGYAGTGYFYLRICDPAAVPSILLITP